MPKDRDQLTPDEPEDREHLESTRGQGTGGTGLDALPTERSAPGGASAGGADESSAAGMEQYDT
jgi:hypothetical protein